MAAHRPPRQDHGTDYSKVEIDGQRKTVSLGPHGSPQARAAYLRCLARLEADATGLPHPLAFLLADAAGKYLAGHPGMSRRQLRDVFDAALALVISSDTGGGSGASSTSNGETPAEGHGDA